MSAAASDLPKGANATDARATVEGEVAHVVHSDDRTTFRVLRLKLDDGQSTTVAGLGPAAATGERVRAVGRWEKTKYGRQLRAEVISPADAVTDQGLARSIDGIAPGIGIGRARRIVAELGGAASAIRALDSASLPAFTWLPERSRVDLEQAWREHRVEREVEARLASLDLTPGLRARLRARYGADAPRMVIEEPYRIAEEVEGVGFLTADDVARKAGLPTDSPARIDAALLHALRRDAEEGGHTCGSVGDLQATLMRIFRERPAPASFAADAAGATVAAVARCLERRAVEVDESRGRVALPALAEAERAVSAGIERVVASVADAPRIEGVEAALAAAGIPLSEEQSAAVHSVAEAGIAVVTGGPGTGKSHLTKAIVVLAGHAGLSVALCAPTARAARRLAEATGRGDACTIHRLLEAGAKGFARCAENPLSVDVVLVDETSMVDTSLMAALLRALPLRCRLVLVGDADQLPPVGPGAPFRDVIASGAVSVARLTEIHRQARGSAIVVGAHAVLAGKTPAASPHGDRSDGCLHVVARGSAEDAADAVLEVVRGMRDELGVDPFEAMVLAPMRKGACGVTALNARLQEMLNPAREGVAELAFGRDDWARLFRVGDKVRQTKNDYARGVVNGDLGRVAEVYGARSEQRVRHDHLLRVRLDDGGPDGEAREVDYGGADLRHLVLAYCGTIHSSQGGQFPAVVMVMHDCHFVMLSRTILYTGMTRAQHACVVVGSRRAIEVAARNARVEERRTALPGLLLAIATRTTRTRTAAMVTSASSQVEQVEQVKQVEQVE